VSAGNSNPTPPVTVKEREELDRIFSEPKFVNAYKHYTKTNSEYHVPYLAGSNKTGTTVYFDPRVPASTKPFIKEHEIVEGVLIRKYGMDYKKAHKFATEAERTKVEGTLGLNWKMYQAKLEHPITEAEKAPVKDTPPDLLTAAYTGTRYFNQLSGHSTDPDKATERWGSSRDDRTERDDI